MYFKVVFDRFLFFGFGELILLNKYFLLIVKIISNDYFYILKYLCFNVKFKNSFVIFIFYYRIMLNIIEI